MKYNQIEEGIFIARPNRFLSIVEISGKAEAVHVKNTSRCKELLTEGVRVFLEKSPNPDRKTGWSLIALEKDGRLFNIDSQAPNQICEEGIRSGQIALPGMEDGFDLLARERTFGSSRLDLYMEKSMNDRTTKAYIEVKGVTLLEDGGARFPDAPTERGVKHVNELRGIAAGGDLAYIVFIIQTKGVHSFTPNDRTHPAFGSALRAAAEEGVRILAYDCLVAPDSIVVNEPVQVKL